MRAPTSGTPVASTITSTGRSTSRRASATPTGRPSATAWLSVPGSSPSTTPLTPAWAKASFGRPGRTSAIAAVVIPGIRWTWATKPMPIWPAPARPIRTGRPSSCSRARRRDERLMRITLLLVESGLGGLPFDHQRRARPWLGQRELLQADVARQRRLGVAVGLQVHVAEVDHVVVGHLPDRGDPEGPVVDADGVAGAHPTGGDGGPVQDAEEVQLLGRALGEPDQQAVVDELRDLLPHRGDRRLIASLRRGGHSGLLDVVRPDPGDEDVLLDEHGQRAGRAGGVDGDRRHLLHRVDPDPGGAAAVDDRDRDLVEGGRALEAVEGLAAGHVGDPLGHRVDAAAGHRVDQLAVVGRLDGQRATPAAATGLHPHCLVVGHPGYLLAARERLSPQRIARSWRSRRSPRPLARSPSARTAPPAPRPPPSPARPRRGPARPG